MNTVNDPEVTPDLIAHEKTYHAFAVSGPPATTAWSSREEKQPLDPWAPGRKGIL
jgi:hypothetical protein